MSEKATKQEDLFWQGEGDAWFQRNQASLAVERGATDWPIRLIGQLAEKTELATVLELGCSNGWRLAHLRQLRIGSEHVGVEVSENAVQDGNQRFDGLTLHHGSIGDIPLERTFDLVIVNFVLHWVDRSLLAKAVSEIDRVTKDNGYLMLGDFCPGTPTKRRYKHVATEGIYTFKQDYAAIFEAMGTYRAVSLATSVAGARDSESIVRWGDNQDRTGFAMLKKSHSQFYIEQ